MATRSEAQMLNQAILDKLDNPVTYKEAADAVSDFTRMRLREEGFDDKILPIISVGAGDLDRQVDTDQPVIVIDKEPNSPAAISVPFATLPINFYIRGPRYRVTFDRILSPKAQKDVHELLTNDMDIRQVMSDNMIKDMLAERDTKFIAASNAAMVGLGSTATQSGVAQWQLISGGIKRETVKESLKIMPRTPSHLQATTCLLNHVTALDFLAWGRDEVGGDMSEDWLKSGIGEINLFGRRFISTIKRDLVPDGSVYQYADPKFLGKSFELEGTTMYVKREIYMLEYFAYQTSGSCFGNTDGICRADFL